MILAESRHSLRERRHSRVRAFANDEFLFQLTICGWYGTAKRYVFKIF